MGIRQRVGRWIAGSAASSEVEKQDTAEHSRTVTTSPRSAGDVSAYRTVNRDRVLEATVAPPGSRQVWQLHRAREESRDLELRGPIWAAYVRFARIQCLGADLSRVLFDLSRKDAERLKPVIERIQTDWMRYQRVKGVGGTGQTVHQLAGSVLHHKLVDGDCFLVPRSVNRRRVWDLHPGDALSEGSYQIGVGGENHRLGVVTDDWNRPTAFIFANDGKLSRLTWGYPSYRGAGDALRLPAGMVTHIRDRSGEVTAVRGWPRCTAVIEEIARLDEWYGALSRSAVLRAAVAMALERDPMYGAPGGHADGLAPGDFARDLEGAAFATDGGVENPGGSPLRPYQEFAARGGTVMTLDPGFKPHNIQTGTPTPQEAQVIGMVERRVCATLRVTAATLLGDYAALSFSAGQLSHQQERQGIADEQQVLSEQFYPVVYRDFMLARWELWSSEHTMLEASDMALLRYPRFVLRTYQVIDKGRLVAAILKAWEAGMLTYAEFRAELGYAGRNPDEVIDEWKENRRSLGLPDSPTPGGGGTLDDDGSTKDPDKEEKERDED